MVKILVLREIQRTISTPEKLQQLLNDTNLLVTIGEKIADQDLSVADVAIEVFKTLGEKPNGPQFLYSGVLLRTFAQLLSKNDSVSFRVYEIVVYVANTSKPALEASIRSGFLQSLISILDTDDILVQLNALTVLTTLASNKDGLDYLEEQGVLQSLTRRMALVDETPFSNMFLPGKC